MPDIPLTETFDEKHEREDHEYPAYPATVQCDGCKKRQDPYYKTTRRDARQVTTLHGWLCNTDTNKDYCPDCVAKAMGI